MEVSPKQLADWCTEVWTMLLGFPLTPAYQRPTRWDTEELLRAEIHLRDGWEGTLRLSCASGLGKTLAAAMFGLAQNEIDEEMVDDALGELANVLSGTMKGLLPDGTRLSLPRVARVSVDPDAVPELTELNAVMLSGRQPVWIEVLKPEPVRVDT